MSRLLQRGEQERLGVPSDVTQFSEDLPVSVSAAWRAQYFFSLYRILGWCKSQLCQVCVKLRSRMTHLICVGMPVVNCRHAADRP